MPRYQPNGTPLTDHEREILVILMEECAEVIQAASKLIRFGKENRPVAGVPTSNISVLGAEVGDLRYMFSAAQNLGLVRFEDIAVGIDRKRERLQKFLQTDAPGSAP